MFACTNVNVDWSYLVLSLESAGAVLAASCCRSAVELAVGTYTVAVVLSAVGLHALLRSCSGHVCLCVCSPTCSYKSKK